MPRLRRTGQFHPAVLGAALACCVLGLAAGCVHVFGGDRISGNLTAVGWTAGGQVVAAASKVDDMATVWTGNPGDRLKRVSFTFCNPIYVLSVFPVPSPDRVGLAVWCADAPPFRLVSLGLTNGSVETLGSSSADIDRWYWSAATNTGYAQYGRDGCTGIGTVRESGVVPLSIRVPVGDGQTTLDTDFPSPEAGPGCQARRQAWLPAVSNSGRYLAFFLRLCAGDCLGTAEFGKDWRVVRHDLSNGHTSVVDASFVTPRGLAVSEEGGLAISARYDGITGIWFCNLDDACAKPHLVAKGKFRSPAYNGTGEKLVATNGANKLSYFDLH